MDRLDELTIFAAILETGSLAGASRKLRRSPPVITRALATLEQRLGVRLVDRTTRRAAVTEAGRHFGEQAQRLLAGYEEAMSAAESAPRGLLRVTAPTVFGGRHVAPVVAGFLDRFPDVRIDLVLVDRNLDLIDDGLDVAVRIGQLADSSLVARRVGQVRRVVVASPAYLEAHGTPASPDDLARHRIIYTASRPGPVAWSFHEQGQPRSVPVAPQLTINHVEAVLRAASAGHGIAIALSYQVASELAAGTLVRLLRPWEPPPLPVQLVVLTTRHMPPRVRAFLDHAAHCLTELEVIRA